VEDKPFGFAMLKTVLQWMDKHWTWRLMKQPWRWELILNAPTDGCSISERCNIMWLSVSGEGAAPIGTGGCVGFGASLDWSNLTPTGVEPPDPSLAATQTMLSWPPYIHTYVNTCYKKYRHLLVTRNETGLDKVLKRLNT
jgi:hypothetical protein